MQTATNQHNDKENRPANCTVRASSRKAAQTITAACLQLADDASDSDESATAQPSLIADSLVSDASSATVG